MNNLNHLNTLSKNEMKQISGGSIFPAGRVLKLIERLFFGAELHDAYQEIKNGYNACRN